jgi:hypothetical protein
VDEGGLLERLEDGGQRVLDGQDEAGGQLLEDRSGIRQRRGVCEEAREQIHRALDRISDEHNITIAQQGAELAVEASESGTE